MKYLAFGEIMARIAPEGPLRLRQALPGKAEILFAGAEANVCVSLSRFGEETRFLTAVPGGHVLADAALATLNGFRIDTGRVLFREGRFGAYYFERGAGHRAAEVTYDRAGTAISLAAPGEYDFAGALDGVGWVHLSGITPALSENALSATLELARRAREKGAKVSFDLNFRSKLWTWKAGTSAEDLARECFGRILPYVDVVIGSPEGAGETLGCAVPGAGVKDGRVDAGANEIVARGIMTRYKNVSQVAFTLRENISASHNLWGGMFLDAGKGPASFAPLAANGTWQPYEIREIVDPLGAGDAFAAGLLHALNSPDLSSPNKAIGFATAAGCLKHSIHGDFNLVSRREVVDLAEGRAHGHVRR